MFDSKNTSDDTSTEIVDNDLGENESGAAFLMRILRYLETPQYLRKSLFPMHSSLRVVVSICKHYDFGEKQYISSDACVSAGFVAPT